MDVVKKLLETVAHTRAGRGADSVSGNDKRCFVLVLILSVLFEEIFPVMRQNKEYYRYKHE